MGDIAELYDYDLDEDDLDERATCKYCGRDDLYWSNETPRAESPVWRLRRYSDGGLHLCLSKRRNPPLVVSDG